MLDYLVEDFDGYLYIGHCLLETNVLQETEQYISFKHGRIYQALSHVEARVILENKKISTVIVDQYLSSGSGIDVMRWVHGLFDMPVILVIMSKLTVDVIVALEAGADDAVFPDISARELVARVSAAARKHGERLLAGGDDMHGRHEIPHAVAHRTPLYFAPEKKRLYFSDSKRINLHGKESDLLEMLIKRYPGYLHREEISKAIFDRTWNPSDRGIDNLVSRLRKVIDSQDTDHGESFIETVRNEGYRLREPIVIMSMESGIVEKKNNITIGSK